MILKSSEELASTVACIVGDVSTLLARILPMAEFHHVGATAIPGALTKGDIDVLLRVASSEFFSAVEILQQNFAIKQPQNWDPFFASFGSDAGYVLPVGVQLVVKDSEADFFLFIHDHFISHPESLAEYNRVKLEFADKGAAEYWAAKNRVLTPIVTLKRKSAGHVAYP